MTCSIHPVAFRSRSAVAISNDHVELIIVMGGGHLASFTRRDQPVNVFWEPAWASLDPGLRRIQSRETYGDGPEAGLLSGILGHNLCVDVFGAQSDGEVAAGLAIHGEVGLVAWEALSAQVVRGEATLVMRARLPESFLEVTRSVRLRDGASCVRVEESVRNLTGVERVYGCAQHVTLGEAFLKDAPALFACNADKGRTWPQPSAEKHSTWAVAADFDYPDVPRRDGGTADWRRYPRDARNSDLCTLRVRPQDELGWFTAVQNACRLGVYYIWERAAYPWLMTWEENYTRAGKPWNEHTLTRGLEFSSYAFALSRQTNVDIGRLFDTPAFQWLDAHATRTTRYEFGLHAMDRTVEEAPPISAFHPLAG